MPKTNSRTIISVSLFTGVLIGLIPVAAGCNDKGAPVPAPQYETQSREAARSTAPDDSSGAPAPASAPQTDPAPPAAAQDDTKIASFLGIRAPIPATWSEQPPQSMMHLTTFRVPAPGRGSGSESGSGGDPQIVVFFFGPGQGGPIDSNIRRWEDQFRAPDGTDVRAEVRTLEVDGLPVTLVELEGEYRGMGAAYTPNQRFITAIVDAPGDRRIFIRFVGDHATVTANREAFIAMIEGMEWVGE